MATPPAIILETQRMDYLQALEKAQMGGTMDDFLHLICKAAERSLDLYLNEGS